jgi:septum formation protein
VKNNSDIILASASPRRLSLLEQVGIVPVKVIPADIDETPYDNELPRDHALRLACEKAKKVKSLEPSIQSLILAADTVVACGRRILPKPYEKEQARECLSLLSGRRHNVYGGIALIDAEGKIYNRLSLTTVKFKRLSHTDIEDYLSSGEWEGKAGGYAIQGLAECYIKFIRGSYSNVVGLSLYDTMSLINGTTSQR